MMAAAMMMQTPMMMAAPTTMMEATTSKRWAGGDHSATVIEGMMQVDAEKVREAEPKTGARFRD